MNARITASQLYSYLTCPHRVVMDAVGDPAERDPVSPFVQLLWERGTAHERDVMAGLGKPFLDLSGTCRARKRKPPRARPSCVASR